VKRTRPNGPLYLSSRLTRTPSYIVYTALSVVNNPFAIQQRDQCDMRSTVLLDRLSTSAGDSKELISFQPPAPHINLFTIFDTLPVRMMISNFRCAVCSTRKFDILLFKIIVRNLFSRGSKREQLHLRRPWIGESYFVMLISLHLDMIATFICPSLSGPGPVNCFVYAWLSFHSRYRSTAKLINLRFEISERVNCIFHSSIEIR